MFHFEREEREIRRRDGKRERELSFHSERKKKEKRERERGGSRVSFIARYASIRDSFVVNVSVVLSPEKEK